MKSFLLKDNTPIIKWSQIPDGLFYEGNIPTGGYDLAVCPTNEKQVILDIDCKEGKTNGYNNIPPVIFKELLESFHYNTKSGGMHIFLNYTGIRILKNCATKYGLDLRIGPNVKTKNAGGYVKFHPAKQGDDIRNHFNEIKDTSDQVNIWLESLFAV